MSKILLVSLLLLSGCATTAGPFVTNINTNSHGDLTVEKCMVKFDPWMSTVNNSDCFNVTIPAK